MFGTDLYGLKPDLVTFAKGLTSAYVPLSAAVVGERVWRVLTQGSDKFGVFSHGYTYSGHPLGVAAANAVLDIVENEKLPDNAACVGAHLQKRLHEEFAEHALVGEVRGVGLMAAIEFVAKREPRQFFDPSLKVGSRIAAACMAEGLIARAMPHGDILGFSPPLVATQQDIEEIVRRAKRATLSVFDELSRDRLKLA